MQTYDDEKQMLEAHMMSKEELAELEEELENPVVAQVVIGKLPNKGQEVTINGLIFLVKFVDYKRGTVQLKLKKYREDTEDANGVTHGRGEIAS